MLNFLTNAIKYKKPNEPAKVEIIATKKGHCIEMRIKDHGLGIDLEKHGDKLFGMYKTFHKHKDARGLGLFITKNQIEAIGGKIEVESAINVGTTFIIKFKNYE
ncbi:ATP-binding protein [Winogradskyella sp.]|nr:ATP-binding protein [Winogradskyella sp.]MDC1504541.1 ATP-binding protein [Winogradskyella sp.]